MKTVKKESLNNQLSDSFLIHNDNFTIWTTPVSRICTVSVSSNKFNKIIVLSLNNRYDSIRMTHYNKSKRWKIMNFLLNNPVIKNKRGQIRSGWIILLVSVALYGISNLLTFLSIEVLRKLLSVSGHYPSSGEQPDAVFYWIDDNFLPIYMQILYDSVMILTPIAAWCLVMKRSLSSMGLKPVKMR